MKLFDGLPFDGTEVVGRSGLAGVSEGIGGHAFDHFWWNSIQCGGICGQGVVAARNVRELGIAGDEMFVVIESAWFAEGDVGEIEVDFRVGRAFVFYVLRCSREEISDDDGSVGGFVRSMDAPGLGCGLLDRAIDFGIELCDQGTRGSYLVLAGELLGTGSQARCALSRTRL